MSYKVRSKSGLGNQLIELHCLICHSKSVVSWLENDTLTNVCKRNKYNTVIVDKKLDVVCDKCKHDQNLYILVRQSYELIHSNA